MRFSLLRSGAFRFAFMMASLFAVGTAILLTAVGHEVNRYAAEAARDTIAAESADLRELDRTSGRAELMRAIGRREQASTEHSLRYLVTDFGEHRLAGSLPMASEHIGWRELAIPNPNPADEDGAPQVTFMTLGVPLADHSTLVVGSDMSDIEELGTSLGSTTLLFGSAISLMALIGGVLVGTVFTRRLDRFNQAVERIIQGNIADRLPAIGMSREFDDLSANLNRMLDRIERLMDGLRQVSSDVAHDLRTPLTRLRQRLEEMRDDASTDASKASVDAALTQVDTILSTFGALLRISTLEAGSVRQRFAHFDLSKVMEQVYRAYEPVAEDSAHVLEASIAPDVIVFGDTELIGQVASNLIENAILHTSPHCRIALAVEHRPDGAIALVVADDGPGIPEGERGNVLRRFHRLDRSRSSPGAGLGLALVSAVADLHDAELRLADNRPGLRVELVFRRPPPTN